MLKQGGWGSGQENCAYSFLLLPADLLGEGAGGSHWLNAGRRKVDDEVLGYELPGP